MVRKQSIYFDFVKRQKAEATFNVNPESDPNINAEQNPIIITLRVSPPLIIFFDFRGKKAMPEGFSVEKKNDPNVTYRKNRLLLDEVYRGKSMLSRLGVPSHNKLTGKGIFFLRCFVREEDVGRLI